MFYRSILIIALVFSAQAASADVVTTTKELCSRLLSREKVSEVSHPEWTGENMVKGMAKLGLPVVTLRLQDQSYQYPYSPEDTWEITHELIRGICQPNTPCEELVSILMRQGSRADVEAWAAKHIPEFKLVWREDLDDLQRLLAERHPEEKIRKVIRTTGSIADAFYHRAVADGFIPLTNHHDLLGHLTAFAIPGVAKVTQRLSRQFAEFITLYGDRKEADRVAPNDLGMRQGLSQFKDYDWIQDKYVEAWNYLQEKLVVFSPRNEDEPGRFSILGGFSTLFSQLYDADHREEWPLHLFPQAFFPYLGDTQTFHFLLHVSQPDAQFPELAKLQNQLNESLDRIVTPPKSGHFNLGARKILFNPELSSLAQRVDLFANQLGKSSETVNGLELSARLEYWNRILDALDAWAAKERFIIKETRAQ